MQSMIKLMLEALIIEKIKQVYTNMILKPIKNEVEYERLLDWIDEQFELGVQPETEAGDALEIALLLIKVYEDAHFAIPLPDPIEALKIKMNEKGLKNKDIVEWIGSKSYVSALLNKKKPLTLRTARIFHQKLGIPADVLLA